MTHGGGFSAWESYDQSTLYFSKFDGGGIWSMPSSGGREQHIAEAPHRSLWGDFDVSDAGLYFIDSSTEPGPTVFFYQFRDHRVLAGFYHGAGDGVGDGEPIGHARWQDVAFHAI